jgi:hypothetical protein
MIRKPTWITIGIFVLLLVFAVFWTQFRPEETDSEGPETMEPPWSVPPSDIVGLKVQDLQSGDLVELEKNSEGIWYQITPIQGQADTELIQQSLNWLSAPKVKREVSTEGGLKQFGLSEPRGMITVILSDGLTKELLIGDITVTGSMTYVIMPHSSSVLLLDKFIVDSSLELSKADLLLPPLPEEIMIEDSETSEP